MVRSQRYAYDLRGHGATSLGAADGTLNQLGADLVAFLENVVSGPATCFGFSLGGAIVLSAAASRPDLVPHAIVLGTSSVVGRVAADRYRSRAAVGRSGDSEALTQALREDTAASIVDVEIDVDDLVARRLIAAVGLALDTRTPRPPWRGYARSL